MKRMPNSRIASPLIAAFLHFSAGASELPIVKIDFNGPSGNTESAESGILGPGIDAWTGVALTEGANTIVDLAGYGLTANAQLYVLEGESSTDGPGGDFLDGIQDPERIRIHVTNILNGPFTVVVYLGSSHCLTTVEGQTKANGILSQTLPGFGGQDYVRFDNVYPSVPNSPTIEIDIAPLAPATEVVLAGIQIWRFADLCGVQNCRGSGFGNPVAGLIPPAIQ